MSPRHAGLSWVRTHVAVAVPARDEAAHITACLTALDGQTMPPDAVILLLNDCTDATETIARGLSLRVHLDVAAARLSAREASAGLARRLAMERAARHAGGGGILLSTDADGAVPPDWVQRNLAALHAGADVVCGRPVVERVEAEFVPAYIHDDDVRERRLTALLDQMAWPVDPDPADPPPRHTEESGTSLGVWVSAWRRAGGIPPVPIGEDRAFLAALRRIDARIRHDPAIRVVVSGRVVGRAEGGMADAIRRRMVQQDEFVDAALEPPADRMRRLRLRARARAVWARRRQDASLAADLGVDPGWLRQALSRPFFGTAWAKLGSAGVLAARHRVRFADLPHHIAVAEALLAGLAQAGTLAAE